MVVVNAGGDIAGLTLVLNFLDIHGTHALTISEDHAVSLLNVGALLELREDLVKADQALVEGSAGEAELSRNETVVVALKHR